MIRSVIVDDEPDARVGLKSMLEKSCPHVDIIGEAVGVSDAYQIILEKKPTLVFLDIRIEDGTSFDLLKLFPKIDFKIIFVTAFDEYAIDAIRYSAIDYILKPVSPSILLKAVSKIEESDRLEKLEEQVELLLMNKNEREKIALPTSDGLLFVKISDILRCEADGSYTNFVLSNNENLLVTRTLKEFETLLPHSMFFRVHKSHLVNTTYIKQYINRDGTYLVMENNDSVPIARNRKDEFLKRLNN